VTRLGRRHVLGAMAVAASVVACEPIAPHTSSPTMSKSERPLTEELRVARSYDEQGVLAFEAGRYHDALLYFEASLARGGPPTERWNGARCHMRLDEPVEAERDLAAYLASSGLSPADRREAETTLTELRRRPSTLTITSRPLGLPVTVDGRHVGATPVTTWVAPGDHIVVVSKGAAHNISARVGKSIIVEDP
jgi:PEGA domain